MTAAPAAMGSAGLLPAWPLVFLAGLAQFAVPFHLVQRLSGEQLLEGVAGHRCRLLCMWCPPVSGLGLAVVS